jgi:predicted NodU family carbamoyl transferase
MDILGISCFYHDSAACLVRDGRILAAAQEERFTRKKHDPRFPAGAVKYCLAEGGISAFHIPMRRSRAFLMRKVIHTMISMPREEQVS